LSHVVPEIKTLSCWMFAYNRNEMLSGQFIVDFPWEVWRSNGITVEQKLPVIGRYKS